MHHKYIQVLLLSVLIFAETEFILSPRMLDLYKEFCGEVNTCSISSENKTKRDVPLKDCLPCECKTWMTSTPPCPDMRMYRCADFRIVSSPVSLIDAPSAYVIDTCPDDTNSNLKELCLNAEHDMLNSDLYPVEGKWNGDWYKFRNMHCILCNNITNFDNHMRLNIGTCENDEFDVNTYNNVEDLLQNVRSSKCSFSYVTSFLYHEDGNSVGYVSQCPNPDGITQCNVTGMWNIWDEDINMACKSYDSRFQIFKNIFCYACNVGYSYFSSFIHTCINHDDSDVEMACIHGAPDQRVFPYRNAACRECNKITGLEFKYNYRFNSYDTMREYPYQGSIDITIEICKLRYSEVYKFLSLSSLVDSHCGSINKFRTTELHTYFEVVYSAFVAQKVDKDIPISALRDEYIKLGGKDAWCDSPDGQKCSCVLNCFAHHNCCPDMLRNDPVECREMNGHHTAVVTKCPDGFSDKIIQYYCERNESNTMTILDNTPTIQDNQNLLLEFKNVFCEICNIPTKMRNVFGYFYIRYIHLQCKKYIDFENFLPLQNSFAKLKEICNIDYKTYYPITPSCSIGPQSVDQRASRCEISQQNASKISSSMKYMCEQTGTFIYSTCKKKFVNIFCEMCSLQNKDCDTVNGSCGELLSADDAQSCVMPKYTMKLPPRKRKWLFTLNISGIKVDAVKQHRNTSSGHCTDLQYNDRVMVSN